MGCCWCLWSFNPVLSCVLNIFLKTLRGEVRTGLKLVAAHMPYTGSRAMHGSKHLLLPVLGLWAHICYC